MTTLSIVAQIRAFYTLVGLLLLSMVQAPGQPGQFTGTNSVSQTNAPTEAEVALSNMLVQAGVLVPTNDVAGTNDSAPAEGSAEIGTNAAPSQAESGSAGFRESRRDWLDRQRSAQARPSRPPRETSEASLPSRPSPEPGGYTPPIRPDYANFQVILQRNIFDPNRSPRRTSGPSAPTKVSDSFGLVGVMSYDKGTFAFFDGTSSDYRKALKLEDTIAGYKLTNIDPSSVKLQAGTNEVELRVGMQMRHEEDGHWTSTTQTQTYAATSSSNGSATASAPTTSGASASDSEIVLERLRKRKEQE